MLAIELIYTLHTNLYMLPPADDQSIQTTNDIDTAFKNMQKSARRGNRTLDLPLTKRMLYQLSYAGLFNGICEMQVVYR